jgi:hypothetical protein
MRSFEIVGCVVTNTGERLGRARVELTGDGRGALARRTRADADGRFAFVIRGADVDFAEADPTHLRVQVTDAAGRPLESATPTTAGDGAIEIVLDERQAEASGLRAPDRRPVLREDFAPTLEAAIGRLAEADRPGARAIIERLTCGLPPFLVERGLVDVARGVLRGRVDDLQRFDEILARAEVWSAAKGVAVPRRDARWVAEQMKALGEKAPHQDDGPPAAPRGTIIELEARLLLLAAAGAAAPDDAAFVRNVELVYGQLAQGEHLAGILASAWDALDGRPDSFRRTLGSLAGCLPPDDKPFPYPPDPGPLGWPDGGTLHWPGEPLPTPPPRFAECDQEALRAIFDARQRAVRYTIDSVEPPRACPGDTLTIRGTNLRFDGQTVGVWFWSGRGTPIHAEPLSPASDTEIRVVVPTGAQCGPLELEVPAGTTVFACGVRIELYSGPKTPFHFLGGETVIKRFSHTAGTCPRSGQQVSFSWEICNATEIELRLVHHAGGVDTTVTPPLAPTDSHYTHVLPPSTLDYGLEVTLTAQGPCGQDATTVRFGVQRTIGAGPSPYISGTFTNWHQNISRGVRETRPDSLQKLVDAVVAAERESMGMKIGARGSGFSFSDCVVPPGTARMIDTSALNQLVPGLLPGVLRAGIASVFPASLQTTLTAAVGAPPPSLPSRLIHVEAGIKIHELNRMLDLLPIPLAMPTLGGSNGQSIAGVISTGTHGANPDMPPIADFVRALHLVGPGGQQWWLEPASLPITSPAAMDARRLRGDLDPCIKIVYDDDLFFSCLVSMGCAGVLYAVVVETVQAYRLSTTSLPPLPWPIVRPMMQSMLVAPAGPAPWFGEILVNASGTAWLTTRTPVAAPPAQDPCATPNTTLRDAVLTTMFGPLAVAGGTAGVIGLGSGAVGAVLGAVPFYMFRRTWELSHQPWRLGELKQEFELIERLVSTVQALTQSASGGITDSEWADLIPRFLNILWQIGLYVVDGRTLVEQIQNLFTTFGQRPPGTTILKSYTAMTGQCDATLYPNWQPTPHSEFERLVESFEFGLPASGVTAFVDEMLASADRIRASNDALILNLAIRFTGATRALLGMQQASRTAHVEIYTIRGMAGNAAMHAEIDRIARARGAWPHWGMFHEVRSDYSGLFTSLPRWRAAMDRIARESAQATNGSPNTFRQGFALARGLLSPL